MYIDMNDIIVHRPMLKSRNAWGIVATVLLYIKANVGLDRKGIIAWIAPLIANNFPTSKGSISLLNRDLLIDEAPKLNPAMRIP